ncbi:hypothetical protein GW17_00058717 [Ensete ventricosum]|nr:hypothetical protein GW17_00058717 [Ensete ventricosum]
MPPNFYPLRRGCMSLSISQEASPLTCLPPLAGPLLSPIAMQVEERVGRGGGLVDRSLWDPPLGGRSQVDVWVGTAWGAVSICPFRTPWYEKCELTWPISDARRKGTSPWRWGRDRHSDIPAGLGSVEVIRDGDRLPGKAFPPRNDRNLSRKRRRWSLRSPHADSKYACLRFDPANGMNLPLVSSLLTSTAGEVAVSSEQKVYDVVLKQAALVKQQPRSRGKSDTVIPGSLGLLKEAYDRCGEVCAEYAKTFYLGELPYPIRKLQS